MTLEELSNASIFKVELEIAEGETLTLRELSYAEMGSINGKGEEEIFKTLKELFPSCAIKTTINKADGSPEDAKKVAKALLESGTTASRLINDWMNEIPFFKKAKSDEQ